MAAIGATHPADLPHAVMWGTLKTGVMPLPIFPKSLRDGQGAKANIE
jgi:hypothetical protein